MTWRDATKPLPPFLLTFSSPDNRLIRLNFSANSIWPLCTLTSTTPAILARKGDTNQQFRFFSQTYPIRVKIPSILGANHTKKKKNSTKHANISESDFLSFFDGWIVRALCESVSKQPADCRWEGERIQAGQASVVAAGCRRFALSSVSILDAVATLASIGCALLEHTGVSRVVQVLFFFHCYLKNIVTFKVF